MSQAGIISDLTTPSADIEFLTGDTGGVVGPDGSYNIDINGATSTTNNTDGITVVGTPGSNLLEVTLTNRAVGSVTTTDATATALITLPAGATPGTYQLTGYISAFESSTPAGATYSTRGGFRTTGAAVTEIGAESTTTAEEAALSACFIELVASSNNIILRVTGLVGTTINWAAKLEFVFVS